MAVPKRRYGPKLDKVEKVLKIKNVSSAEKVAAVFDPEYRWKTPAGLAKRIGPAPTPPGKPQAWNFIVLRTNAWHSYSDAQVKEIK